MQLIKVHANRDSFRTVTFQENKPNFIIAEQKDPHANDRGKTYNGVGKSLLVSIIHFCLGASITDYRSFCEQLPGWVFSLDFKIGSQYHTVSRGTDTAKNVVFNDQVISLTAYTKQLGRLCFDIPEDTPTISFRALIPFFIRPSKASYVECRKPGKTGSEYQSMLYNAFLLGLDITLAQKKYHLKKELDRISKLAINFKNDSLLREFFSGTKDLSLTLIDLDEEITKLERDLESFQVADDYHDIQVAADQKEKALFEVTNEITILSNNIEQITKSLKITPSKNSSDIESVYAEAKILFPETVRKELAAVDSFYQTLLTNRIRRLSEQMNALEIKKRDKSAQAAALQEELDELLGYLGEHQALDLFISLSRRCAELKSRKEHLEQYQVLQREYKAKERQTEKEMIELSEITDTYLARMADSTSRIRDTFRSFAKKFYPDSTAGLTITTNEKENQLVFTIDPKIESDGSDGINNVKLFCYDLSILFEGYNHHINCIFHDSRLFDGVDERQKALMFRLINERFTSSNTQYIATVNQNQLKEIKSQLSPEEFDTIITDHTILTLTDENDEEKLLGIPVDIAW